MCNAVKPLLAYGIPVVETIVSRDVRLSCTVLAGNPTPRVTWYFMGEQVNNTDRHYDDGRGNLFIKKVQVDDEGEYMCTASNAAGSTSNVLKLDVLGKCGCIIIYANKY